MGKWERDYGIIYIYIYDCRRQGEREYSNRGLEYKELYYIITDEERYILVR